MAKQKKYTPFLEALVESFMETYGVDASGNFKVINESTKKKTDDLLKKIVLEKSVEIYESLESDDDEIDFEEKNADPSHLDLDKIHDNDEDSSEEGDEMDLPESFDMSSLFEEDYENDDGHDFGDDAGEGEFDGDGTDEDDFSSFSSDDDENSDEDDFKNFHSSSDDFGSDDDLGSERDHNDFHSHDDEVVDEGDELDWNFDSEFPDEDSHEEGHEDLGSEDDHVSLDSEDDNGDDLKFDFDDKDKMTESKKTKVPSKTGFKSSSAKLKK